MQTTLQIPPFEVFRDPDLYESSFENFNFHAPEHRRITAALNQPSPISVRNLATHLGLTRPEMQNLMAESGWAMKPDPQKQWRSKPGFTHYFKFDRKAGYILSLEGCESLALILYKRLSRPPSSPITTMAAPLRAEWRGYLPPDLTEQLEVLTSDKTANFSLLAPLAAYLQAYEDLQLALDQVNTPSSSLLFTELEKTLAIPVKYRNFHFAEFMAKYVNPRTKMPVPGYEDWFHTSNSRVYTVTPKAVYQLFFSWMRYKRRFKASTAPEVAVQTPVYATKPAPPIAAPAPKTAPVLPPEDLNTPAFGKGTYEGDLVYRSPPPDDLKVEGNDLSVYGTAADKLKYIDPNDPDDLGAF